MPCAAIANRTVSSLARNSSIRPTAVDPAGPRSRTWFAATAVVEGVAVAVGGVPALVSGSSVPRVKTNASTIATIASAAPMSSAPPRREEDSRVGAGVSRSAAASGAESSSNQSSPRVACGRLGRSGRPWRRVVARRRLACAPRRAGGRRGVVGLGRRGRGLAVHARLVGARREGRDGLAAGDLAQRRGDLRGPAVRIRLGQEQRTGAFGVGLRLLAEEPVRDLARPGRRGQVRGQRGEAAPGAGADRLFGHPEQVGQLAVGPSLAQDELHGGALVGRQPVKCGGAACRHLGA